MSAEKLLSSHNGYQHKDVFFQDVKACLALQAINMKITNLNRIVKYNESLIKICKYKKFRPKKLATWPFIY
jgi:hypothetical protein